MSRKFKVPLNLVGLTTDPGSATNGDLYFNTVSNKVRYYTQNTWQDLGAAAGGATVQVSTTIPATATEGKLWYDNDDAHLYVFDGTYWVEVSIGPVGPAGPTGAGVATAGTTGQYLVKSSNNNYETAWSTLPAASLTSTDVSRLTGATSNLQTQINTLSTNLGNTLDDYVPIGDVGQPDGVASLDSNGKIPIAQLGNLIDGAPAALDTLNELAAAINDDSSYAATITTALGLKAATSDIAELAQDAVGNNLSNLFTYNDSTGGINLDNAKLSDFLMDGASGNSYGLIGTSAYLDVKNTNGYNKEIELDITAVEAKLVTDGFAKLASPTFTGTVTIPSGASISGFAPLNSPTFTGTVILPNSTVTNSMLANSSITINGSAVSLGGSTTIAAGLSPVAVSTNVTMVKNTRYFVDTTSDLTLTLPATPSLGDEIELYDAGNNAFNNDVIILRNGEKINGLTDDAALDINGFTVSFVYTGSTYGWRMK